MTIYTRDEIELITAYEDAQKALRAQLTNRIYYNAIRMLDAWQSFEANLQPGGEFAALAEQYVADSKDQITPEEIATMAGALTVIVSTMQAIASRGAGMFPGITLR